MGHSLEGPLLVKNPPSQCPVPFCTAPGREQVNLDAEDLSQAGLSEDWITGAMRCTYCKYIYSIDGNGKKTVRGHFEGDLMEIGRWRPYKGD